MKIKNFLKMENIPWKIPDNLLGFVRFCEGTFRLEEAIYKFD